MGDVTARTRKRAVGTRDRVLSHLAAAGEVRDASGMASTVLAEAVGYPGSSIAFAQLLSGMERSGLIKREVRGKRTYRITAARGAVKGAGQRGGSRSRAASAVSRGTRRPAAPVSRGTRQSSQPSGAESPGAGPARTAPARRDDLLPAGDVGRGLPPEGEAGEFDYDELARRLLVQVVRRLAAEPAGRADRGETSPEPDEAGEHPLEENSLRQTVASLERKLASVQSRQRTLAEENEKLREQLHEAQRSLARVQERATRPRISERLGTAEEALLERLLSLAGTADRGEEAGTG